MVRTVYAPAGRSSPGPVLKRIVELIVQEGPLIAAHDPSWAPRGRELREALIRAITTKYSTEDVRPYAPKLLRWVENRHERWAGDLRQFLRE